MTSLDDQVRAASAAARRATDRMVGQPSRPGTPWVAELLDRVMADQVDRCEHLVARPVQPVFVNAWERRFRCRRCVEANTRTMAGAIARGAYRGLGAVEEGTCDGCRRYCGADRLTVGVLRIGLFVLLAGLCSGCVAAAQRGEDPR